MACRNVMDQAVDETALVQEICRLRKLEKDLIARMFKLKSKLYISRPISFKDYEELVPPSRPVYTNSLVACNLILLAKMYKWCGVQFTEAKQNFFCVELTVVSGDMFYEGFFVEIKKKEKKFRLGAFHVPSALDMNELEKKSPMNTYDDIVKFLQFLHRCISAYFHRVKQLKEFKKMCMTYSINAEVFATHDMKYLEIKLAANDFIVSNVKSLVSFCFVYNSDSLIPINGSLVQKDMTEDEVSALHVCIDFFMSEHLPSALSNIINENNFKKKASNSSNVISGKEQVVNFKAKNFFKGEESSISVDKQIDLQVKEDKVEKSISGLDISSITTSEVGEKKEPVKKGISSLRGFPIAESTPLGFSRRQLKSSTNLEKKKVESATSKRNLQRGIGRYFHSRNYLERPEENGINEQGRSNMKKSDESYNESRKRVPYRTNALNTTGTQGVLSNSYEETPPVHFSKHKFKRTR